MPDIRNDGLLIKSKECISASEQRHQVQNMFPKHLMRVSRHVEVTPFTESAGSQTEKQVHLKDSIIT